jgi:hypothetical protein
MRPASAIRIENSVTIDDFVVLVFEKGKIVAAGKFFLELGDKFPGGLGAVDAHGQDFSVVFPHTVFQLAELSRAVGSPVAAVKNQHDAFLAAVIG